MPNPRALDRRRKSIQNIRKITRTMELISTARFKRAMTRAMAGRAYADKLAEVVRKLVQSGLAVSHPLLEPHAELGRAAMLVLTANRGLCGGYNSGVLRLAYAQLDELHRLAPEVRLEVSGKRGISAFRFRRTPMDERFTHFEDKPAFAEIDVLANRYIDWYERGEMDRLDVVYTRFFSASRQEPVVETLLPMAGDERELEEDRGLAVEYELLPSAESILRQVVPATFKVRLLECFLDAAVSEQMARMTAMKAATENADTMIGSLSIAYNRARQTQITSDLLEVISGSEALNG